MARRCIMGCTLEIGQKLHTITRDPKRKAEWYRILGVYPRTKRAYICGRHFSNCYLFGNRLSRYAMPNPPESRKSNSQTMSTGNFPYINSSMYRETEILENIRNASYIYDSFLGLETETVLGDAISENLVKDPLHINCDSETSLNDSGETEKLQETVGKVEDFEIRKGSTNDMIIKGRYVQTNDYLVVSYTPPKKWSLQEQVRILDKKCEQQLQKIRQLNKENYRLFMELHKHERLLPRLRYLQTHNRLLLLQLKMWKIKAKRFKKQVKE